MKRADLMKQLRDFARDTGQPYSETEGGSHTKVTIGNRRTVVPRHREINEITAKSILKQVKGE